MVVGSTPTGGAFFILLATGSHSVVVSTPDLESGDPGSNPGGSAFFLRKDYCQRSNLTCLEVPADRTVIPPWCSG
jgi:hypothetical protein